MFRMLAAEPIGDERRNGPRGPHHSNRLADISLETFASRRQFRLAVLGEIAVDLKDLPVGTAVAEILAEAAQPRRHFVSPGCKREIDRRGLHGILWASIPDFVMLTYT